jgi:DNA replication and repair protein RecF
VVSELRLAQYKDEEVAAKATLVGPHRDDFIVTKNDLDISKYGSRGEQRLAIVWLKLAELAFIERETGERPLLILDDIFSELDKEHKILIFDLLGKQQTIVTSAEEEVLALFKKHRIPAEIIHL